MINIRKAIFETNSSSTHSLVIMEKSQYKKWDSIDDNGNPMFLSVSDGYSITPENVKLYTFDELKKKLDPDNKYSDEKFIDFAEYHGYITTENLNSIETEFDKYVIMSVFISE